MTRIQSAASLVEADKRGIAVSLGSVDLKVASQQGVRSVVGSGSGFRTISSQVRNIAGIQAYAGNRFVANWALFTGHAAANRYI